MNDEVIESVLNEQKEMLKLNKQLAMDIENLAGKLEEFEKTMNTPSNIASIDDTKDLAIIIEYLENIKHIVVSQEKNIVHEKRIIIFPEFKSTECYRLLFNCILYLTIATCSFLIIKAVVNHWYS